ncbi:MAG: hypothetical protein WCK32_00720 [Chlorobiaceae bacterium]
MSQESVVVNPSKPASIPDFLQLAPVLVLPLAFPLVLHAIHGIAVGGIGLATATLVVLGPKGSKQFFKSSGKALYSMLPSADKSDTERDKDVEMIPASVS